MENSRNKFGLNTITAIVVFIVVVIMIITKVSEVKKENLDSRQGTNSAVSK